MKRSIRKVAVLGSGVMGSRIACHFANIGAEVLLLDIVPRELSEKEKAKGLTLDNPAVRNRVTDEALKTAIKTNPSPLYDKAFAKRITTGNFDDHMPRLGKYDWIIEAVVENLAIKKSVFENVEKYRTPGTLITSNTSGIPIHMMAEGRSDDFRKHFCGTHFFNPPRYLKLLEIIPTPETDPTVIHFLGQYGDRYLGKTVVHCKDTPAFIANRVGIYSIMKVVQSMNKLGLTIDEVDKLTGPVIGRPKSATFRTSDVVGLDTLAKVADNLYQALPHDEEREIFKLPEVIGTMMERNWLGEKTKQGFYKKTKDEKGQRQILTLDLETLEYRPKQKSAFPTLEMTKSIDQVKDRFKILFSGQDKAGEFYRDSFFGLFRYVTNRIPEITDHIYKIDEALKAGFGWEMGPFETWDSVKPKKIVKAMEEAGYKPANWFYEMQEAGCETFYKVENGVRKFYDIQSKSYKPVPGTEGMILLDNLRQNNVVWSNTGVSLFDIGDGVLNLEFHTKMNTLGGEVIEGINKAIEIAEKSHRGLIIGNEGANFSAGANLGLIFMNAVEQEFDEIDFMVRAFQNCMMRARYSDIPVVVAPHGMTLGGGCEITLHADAVQAAAETYIGLVEVGVGLIPAGGGTKEMALRTADSAIKGDVEYNRLQEAFMNIATAKVATSAHEALNMGILSEHDSITVNKARQIADAKIKVLELAEAGYTRPAPRNDIKVEGRGGMAMFLAGIHGMRLGNYISDHDAKIGKKVAYVMCGGDLSAPAEVSEQYLLDLEREAFLSLTGEKKTLERIQAVLQRGKPIRN
ncbi:3-hydroxyacyl-CoA dehydrogenase [Fulvitalea axinellae]|uniref:3-hydroxyacyl-CoA dehydrogenase n=1 Tax=Fulvitalea axinellae TaxID=1182444 RepID=A0AAU9D0H8_9BACT|nr:3-hydroxyacyl-CoA dehydrogenase [Fulvitalea axinellae]